MLFILFILDYYLIDFQMVYLWMQITPDSKFYGANAGPIWGRKDPVGPHVGPMNFAIWDIAA